MISQKIAHLNPPQQEAVTSVEGPLLIIAGAGSGKTRVITHRIAYLLEDKRVEPWQIFAATFTNKAAREMKSRVARLCDAADTSRLSIATFHSQCANILRNEAEHFGLTPRFTICDATDQSAIIKACMDELKIPKKAAKPREVREAISLAKMALKEGDDAAAFIGRSHSAQYAKIYAAYQEKMRQSDAVDFDDLLLLVARFWRENSENLAKYQNRYHYVLVDEYQDTNLAQFEIVRLLTEKHRNLCVVGDEDQSIYSWRGAEISNLLEFQKHFAEARIIRLEQNYRSVGNILAAAHEVIQRNTQRLGKELWTDQDMGDPVIHIEASSETDEAGRIAQEIKILQYQGMPLSQVAIFYRVNALSRVYEDALRKAKLPYQVVGGLRFYDRAEIKDILAYLQALSNPSNLIALLRILNRPSRSIGKVTESRIINFARERALPVVALISREDLLREAGVTGKAAKGALELAGILHDARQHLATAGLRGTVEWILQETGYQGWLGDPKAFETASRLENIEEFMGSIDQFVEQQPDATLDDYLEMVALRSEESEEAATETVSLMTVHNAKGLEFDVVFVVALERDLFPNGRALREQMHDEEERRLFYVALTRARQRVYLSNAFTRRLYGRSEWPAPSRFLREIPARFMKKRDSVQLDPLTPTAPEPAPFGFSAAPPHDPSEPAPPPPPPPDMEDDMPF